MSSAVTSGRKFRCMMAALFTRMSSLPNAFVTAANIPGISAGLPTSAFTAMAKLVSYSWRVQGAGFRATVAAIARQDPVSGWVKNLGDGRVQLLAEGDATAVEAFLAAVRERWGGHIDTEESHEQESSGRY